MNFSARNLVAKGRIAEQNYDSKYGFTNGQWGFLILAACSAHVWRIISSTQLLPYDLFFWGGALVPAIGAICVFAFPFAFQEGFFAKSALTRIFVYAGIGPLLIASVWTLVHVHIGRIGVPSTRSWLLPFSPIRNEYDGQHFPYTIFTWCICWLPYILLEVASLWLIGLILAIPRKVHRMKVLVWYIGLEGIAMVLATTLGWRTYGQDVWGPNPRDASVPMMVFNELLGIVCGGYLLLRIEKAFRPSLFYIVATGLIGSVPLYILRGPTDWYMAGATLISTALSLWIIDSKWWSIHRKDDESLQSE